jgi:hypothetical protein
MLNRRRKAAATVQLGICRPRPSRLTITKNLKYPDSLGGDGRPGRESTVDGNDQPAVIRADMIIHGAYP